MEITNGQPWQNSERTLCSGKKLLNATKSPQTTNLLCEQADHCEPPKASQQPNILRESTLLQPHVKNQTPFEGNHSSVELFRATNFQRATMQTPSGQ
jgi:hypothetical protein